jgi:hypothetical protein
MILAFCRYDILRYASISQDFGHALCGSAAQTFTSALGDDITQYHDPALCRTAQKHDPALSNIAKIRSCVMSRRADQINLRNAALH